MVARPLAVLLLVALRLAADAADVADAAAGAVSPAALAWERWYVVSIGGMATGFMRVAVNAAEAGLLRHTEEMDAHVSRGSDRVRLRMECWVEEDEATGRVVNAGYTQRLADDTVSMAFGYHDDRVDIMSTSGGQESRSSIPAPSVGLQFVGLAAADRAFRAALAGGEEVWEAVVVKPEFGPAPRPIRRSRRAIEDAAGGEASPIGHTAWLTNVTGLPVPIHEMYDADGAMAVMRVESQFGLIRASLSSREVAIAATSHSGPLPELVYGTSVILSTAHPMIHRSGVSATMLVTLTTTSASPDPLVLPTSGYQHVTTLHDGSLVVTLDLESPPVPAPEEHVRNPYAFLESSAMVTAADPTVSSLAADAVAAHPCAIPLDCAAVLRTAARAHFTESSLATGYASAAEAARTRKGDCTEHAVLLAAMSRAQYIPARVCTGLVYTRAHASAVSMAGTSGQLGAFGWHQWTQVMVDGAWVDMDATMMHSHFSPGHILASCSALSDAEAHMESAKIMHLIGNLRIEMLDVKYT